MGPPEDQVNSNVKRDPAPGGFIMAIGRVIYKHNQRPKPFIWTAKASDILEKVKRARRGLDPALRLTGQSRE